MKWKNKTPKKQLYARKEEKTRRKTKEKYVENVEDKNLRISQIALQVMNERVLSIHFHSFSKHVLGVYFCAGHRYVWSIKQGLETHYSLKVRVAYINQRITHTSNYKLWKVLWCKRRGWKKEHVTVNWPSLGVRRSFLYMGGIFMVCQAGFPQKQALRQGFGHKWLISELIPGSCVNE